jgi:hypothetical protein
MIMKKVSIILFACILSFQFAKAQEITSHQYRKVAPENMQEYIKRETTYWQKWAEKEVTKGNLVFWGIFQKMGGVNQENEPNILIINTFKDWDKGAEWMSIQDLFPNIKIEDIQTQSLSTDTDQIYLRDLDNHIQAPGVVASKDFKYVRFLYHNTIDNGKHLKFEAEKWKPMVEKAMADGKTSMKGWGNSSVISPESGDFPYNSASYDLFSTIQDALSPAFSSDMTIPDGFWDGLSENYNTDRSRNSNLYRIVSVVTPTPSE